MVGVFGRRLELLARTCLYFVSFVVQTVVMVVFQLESGEHLEVVMVIEVVLLLIDELIQSECVLAENVNVFLYLELHLLLVTHLL